MQPKSFTFYEIKISMLPKPGSKEKILGLLEDAGFKPESIALFEPPGKMEGAVYTPSAKAAEKVKSLYRQNRADGMRLKVRLLEKEDWFDKWQIDYQMFPLGRKLMLVPAWQSKEFKDKKRVPIYLDPKGVFGSGQHPATQIMASWLEHTAGKFKSVLDLGTGTGILAVGAAKLGAETILAADHDPASVRSAKFNFKLNGIKGAKAVRADVLKMRKSGTYDLVCANLFTNLLLQIKPLLFSSVKPGGYLALCGVHVQNYPEFKKKFHHPKFRCVKIIQKRGWSGMLFKSKA